MYGRVCIYIYIYIYIHIHTHTHTWVSSYAHAQTRKFGSTNKNSTEKNDTINECITENREAIKGYARDACILWLTVVSMEPKIMWIYYHAWRKTKSVNPHSHMHVCVCVRTYTGIPSFPGWTRSDDQWPVFSLHLTQCDDRRPSSFLWFFLPIHPMPPPS